MIVKGARSFVLIPLLSGIVVLIVSVLLASYVHYVLANVLFLLFVVLVVLFRDPPRDIAGGVVSPADGRIVNVNKNRNSVTISNAIHKVHVIRAPLGGRVLNVVESSRDRGVIETTVATQIGPVRIRQNPKSAVGKAIPRVSKGSRVSKGQRIGIILPTGLVTVELPERVTITVREGQKVLAGEASLGGVLGTL